MLDSKIDNEHLENTVKIADEIGDNLLNTLEDYVSGIEQEKFPDCVWLDGLTTGVIAFLTNAIIILSKGFQCTEGKDTYINDCVELFKECLTRHISTKTKAGHH